MVESEQFKIWKYVSKVKRILKTATRKKESKSRHINKDKVNVTFPSRTTIEISINYSSEFLTSTPQKCVLDKDIIEHCKPKFWSSTVKSTSLPFDLIKDETIEEIRKLLPENHFDCSFEHTIESIQESYERNVETKFVTNLFESRRSQRRTKNTPRRPKLEKIEIIDQTDWKIVPEDQDIHSNAKSDSDTDMLHHLKKLRDIECVKLNQASNVLKLFNENSASNWKEKLLAQRILLEHELKYNLISSRLQKSETQDPSRILKTCTADISFGNFEFLLKNNIKDKNRRFFLLVLSNSTDLFITDAVESSEKKIIFETDFCFSNVEEDFCIQASVYSIAFKKQEHILDSFFKKKPKINTSSLKIKYENINTCEEQESRILKSSFIKCGTATFTRENINQNSMCFSVIKENSIIQRNFQASASVRNVNLNANISGFLTIGKADADNNFVYWDRKWCLVTGSKFFIYNYPQEEELEKPPEAVIDLKSALDVFNVADKCPRRKSFLIKRRSTLASSTNFFSLKHRNGSGTERYLLAADDKQDVEKWTEVLNFVMESLEKWESHI